MDFPDIPKVNAVTIGNEKQSGSSNPLEMRCINESDSMVDDYIVKLRGDLNLSYHSLAREIYGFCLANFFGIETPNVAIVNISDSLIASQKNQGLKTRLSPNQGSNFGSRYVSGAMSFVNPLSPNLINQAIRIFCFDMFIGNIDRTHIKPNLFVKSSNFIVFDHEKAFPFSKPNTFVGGFPKPWIFIKESWHKEHVFYNGLKGVDGIIEIESFIDRMNDLNNDIFVRIDEQLPAEWITPDLNPLKAYLSEIRENSNLFKRSIQELLV